MTSSHPRPHRPHRPLRRRLAALGVAAGLVATVPAVAPAPATASDDAPVAGALTSGDPLFPNQGNGGYDVQHYDVGLRWDPGVTLQLATIDATVGVTARTTGAPLSSFALDFEGSMLTVSSVTVDGVAATFTRVDGTGTEPPAAHKLVVTPATPVSGTFTTVVEYAGIPSSHTDTDGSSEGWNVTNDGATFLAQPIGAMAGLPVNNTPADKATFDFSFDIPSTITNTAGTGAAAAVSNGELLSRTPSADGTRTTWVWDQTKPMATELILISIGKYDMITSDVTLSDGRVIPEWSFIDSAQSAANKTTFTNRRAQLSTHIQRMESLYGPYPGASAGIVMDTVPSGINYALETQDRSFFPSVGSVNGNTYFHELAHQWYGDAVSPKIWNDIWINEGMGTWGPTWYTNVLAPTTPNPAAVETFYFSSWNGTAASSASWNTPPSAMTSTNQLYGYQTYTRGAQLYEALRTAIGTPDYLRFLKQWQARYGGGNGGAAEFEALAEEVSGRDLTAFFADWVHEAGKPAWPFKHDLALTTSTQTAAPGDRVTYTVKVTNTGRVPMTPVVAVDLADVLDDADLAAADLPAGAVLDGTTLTWTVPSTPTTAGANTAEIAIPVTVDADASSDTLTATARATTLGSTCTVCTATAEVDAYELTPAPLPTIAGTPRVGSVLTAVTDGWPAGTTFAYRWSVGGEAVVGADGATYTPRPSDIGLPVQVRVTGSREGNLDTVRTSEPTTPVAVGEQSATPTPTVSGTPRVGETLTAVPGDWDAGTTLTYQWRADDVAVEGATAETFVPTPAQRGAVIAVAVTSTREGYTPVTRVSEPTAPVAAGTPSATPTPTISGTPRVDVQLVGDAGTWDGGTTLAYQWLVDGAPVEGATGQAFTPGPGLVGAVVTLAVTGTRDGYETVTRTSEPTAPVAPGPAPELPIAQAKGQPRVGATLQVLYGGPFTDGPLADSEISVRWRRDGVLTAQRGERYLLGPADLGAEIAPVLVATRPGYETATRTGTSTEPVARGLQTLRPAPVVRGTAKVGATLIAYAGAHDAGTTVRYAWYADGRRIAGATASRFVVTSSRLGDRITVVTTTVKPAYEEVVRESARTAAVVR